MGIAGSGTRKEIVMLGETVERAFLFMQTATKVYGRIFVDLDTKSEATHMIDFEYLEHIQFADKLLNYPVFAPVDPFIDYENPSSIPIKPSQLIRQIRLHANPFKLDFDNGYQATYCKMFGSTEVIPQIIEDLKMYTLNTEEHVWALAVKGKAGTGKSLFVRCLLAEVIKN